MPASSFAAASLKSRGDFRISKVNNKGCWGLTHRSSCVSSSLLRCSRSQGGVWCVFTARGCWGQGEKEGLWIENSRSNSPPRCRMTGQTELGGDVGNLICILISRKLKHAKWLGFITCLDFVRCHLGGRSKAFPDTFIHVPLHSSQLFSEAVVCSQGTAAGGMIPAILPWGCSAPRVLANPPPTNRSCGSR